MVSTSPLPDPSIEAVSEPDVPEGDESSKGARYAHRISMGKGTLWRFGSPLDHDGAEIASFTGFPLMINVEPLYRGQFLVGLSSFKRNAPGGISYCGDSHVIRRRSHLTLLLGRWKVQVSHQWRDRAEEERSVADSALRRQVRALERALQPSSPLPDPELR